MSSPTVAVHLDPESLPRGQQERRDRIVRAAISLLEHGGEYDAIQMRDVAGEGGVALGTVYRYFTSKEHLYAAALLEWASNFPAGAESTRADSRSDEDRLRALMRRAVRAFERYPQMMRVEIVIESSPDPNARALFDQFAQRNVGALTSSLASVDAETAAAIVETVNSVLATRLRSWALGRITIGDVDRSVQKTLDLIFAPMHPRLGARGGSPR
jgi:TetR/AcrR family transcriptional regulator, cholesterol catabolism regulator